MNTTRGGVRGEDKAAIWIIGTGGHARVVLDLALDCGHPVQGFIDPAPDAAARRAQATEPVAPFNTDLAVLDGMAALREIHAPKIVVAIGSNALRRETMAEAVELGAKAITLVHPSARVEASAKIAPGVQVCIGAIVNSAALINSGAIIEHECDIGAFAHICPGVALGGRVRVGAGAMVGIGSSVIQGVTIGENAIVGAGAVVLGDVEPGETVVGVPARAVPA